MWKQLEKMERKEEDSHTFFPSLYPSLPLKEGNEKHLSWTGVAVTVESEVESESDLDQI